MIDRRLYILYHNLRKKEVSSALLLLSELVRTPRGTACCRSPLPRIWPQYKEVEGG